MAGLGKLAQGAKLTHMSTDDTASPAGRFDEGEPIYYVHDKNGLPLSFHRTTQGAETNLKLLAGADGITETTLHH